MHQVYSYGVIAPSTLVELEGTFPPEAGYAEINRVVPSLGGEAANSAYVLARLGVATKLSGSRLSQDDASDSAIALLSAAGVDCSAVARDADDSVTEIVISSAGQRTIFATYGRMLAGRAWNPPSRDDICSSRVVCLDPFFGEESGQAAVWCLEAGVPYVTVDTTPDNAIAQNAAAIVVSEEFSNRTFETEDPSEILDRYSRRCRGLVVLTRGGRELLYGRPGVSPQTVAPHAVAVRDTAGAGDSFRAGVAYGILQGASDARIIELATAIAALVVQTSPGVVHSPTREELEAFLA